jgi:hypothetical protein
VRRRGSDVIVLSIATSNGNASVPYGTDEVHVHLVQGGPEELRAAVEDLSALVLPRPPLYIVDRQAA